MQAEEKPVLSMEPERAPRDDDWSLHWRYARHSLCADVPIGDRATGAVLRERGPDEVPRIQAQALRAAGVPDSAISVIPDEQEAIEAALRMGEAGDLLLIFADALVRSWKQITKFKTSAATAPRSALHSAPAPSPAAASPGSNGANAGVHSDLSAAIPAEMPPDFNLEGFIRDERGIHMAPESSD